MIHNRLACFLFLAILPAAVCAADQEYARPYQFVEKCCVDFDEIGSLQITRIDGAKVIGVITESSPSLPRSSDTIYAYPFTGTLEKGRLRLKTETVSYRFSPAYYRFDGRFTHLPPYEPILNNHTAVLEGRLAFYSDGKLAAEGPVTLAPYGLRALTEKEKNDGR